MSKLIVEMEMPRNCDECVVNYDCAFCGITGSAFYGNTQMPNFAPDEQKLPDCPIVGVLPETHGDLIDRDAFIHKYLAFYTEQERKKNLVFAAVEVKQQFADMICDERPLIAAERNET